MDEMGLLLNMVKSETLPAVGCTEPVAVAYAAAHAKKYLDGAIEKVEVIVSQGLYKNGKFVIIPNAGQYGLDLAACLGVLCGNPEDGLLIFQNVTEKCINAANKLIADEKVKVDYIRESPPVYVEVILHGANKKVKVIVENQHDHVQRIEVDDQIIYEDSSSGAQKSSYEFLGDMHISEIRKIVETVPIEDLLFLEEGIEMNVNASNEGLKAGKGMALGATLNKMLEQGTLQEDVPTKARILAAAAADMRMGGENWPIMTSAGSGNQGIGVTIPLYVVAQENAIEKERLLRALFYAHIINKYIKSYTGKLSAICGCSIAAGVGASVGISWMLGGSDEQIAGAASNLLANITGMVCDGAKETCSLKVSTASYESIIAAYLALEDVIAPANIGLIGQSIEHTIKNLGILSTKGFIEIDHIIVDLIK